MGYVQKILLLIITIGSSLFLAIMFSYFLFWENNSFTYDLIIPYFISGVGICSFWFHLKTLKFYKLKENNVPLPEVAKIFWLLDFSFGIIYLILTLLLIRTIVNLPGRVQYQDNSEVFITIILMFVIGAWTVMDAIYLNILVKRKKHLNRFPEIDDIKGNGEEQIL